MSAGISAGGWAVIGLVAGSLLSQKPNPPAPPPPAAPPQESKRPDAGNVLSDMSGRGQAGGAPGVAQTFLTGPGGIDPEGLKLGRTTLLGA